MPSFRHLRNCKSAFTIVEVALAAAVLAFALTTSIVCLQIGVRDMDLARTATAVSQALQNEMERLRLEDWETIAALPESETLDVSETFSADSAVSGKVRFRRTVSDVPGFADMKEIVVTADWASMDGRPHSRTYRMRYARSGLFDYYYKSNVEL